MANERYDWAKEYQEFLTGSEVPPPSPLTETVRRSVQRDLQPAPLTVFSKVAACVALAGGISLSFCPQFDMGAMHHSPLHHFFMSLGPLGCSMACGLFFTVIGFVSTALILRPEELRIVRSNRVALVSTLSALSLSAFVCAGATVFLETALVWFAGSWLGGFVTIEIASSLVLGRIAAAKG